MPVQRSGLPSQDRAGLGRTKEFSCAPRAGPPLPSASPHPWPSDSLGHLSSAGRRVGGAAKSYTTAGAVPRGRVRPTLCTALGLHTHTGSIRLSCLPSPATVLLLVPQRRWVHPCTPVLGSGQGNSRGISWLAYSPRRRAQKFIEGMVQGHHTLPLPPNKKELEK